MRGNNKLTTVQVSKLNEPGRYADGDGLYLQVSPGGSKQWLLRYMRGGVARSMGLGGVNVFSLKEARERARKFRQQLADGIDPIAVRKDQRRAAMAEAAKQIAFADAAAKYIEAQRAGWKNAKHGEQWTATLATYAFPIIGDLSVAGIETAHILRILEPIWNTKTETASRVRGRIESVLDWATARGHRQGENPARWKGHLALILPARSKVQKVKHHDAMPYQDVPTFIAKLHDMPSLSALALEFTILTAVRTGETIGARWPEIDFRNELWTVPAERTKSGREHRVPLSARAVTILKGLPREVGNDHVFIGARKGRGLSNMAMLELLRGATDNGYTVHGFRSAFRDWCGEATNYPRELAEAALAHAIRDKTEAAYARGDALEKRRRLMMAWAGFCSAPARARGKLIPMKSDVA